MKPFIFLIIFVTFTVTFPSPKKVRLTYISISGSVYGVLADNSGPVGFSRDSYFNTLKLLMYMNVLGWTVSVGVPEQLTLELYDEKYLSRYGIHLSDLSLEIGKRIGRISPKLIFKIPPGYPTRNSVAWIGSGNVRAGLGVSAGLGQLLHDRISLSGDLEVLSTVNDTAGYPRFGIGSISGWGDVKSTISITSNLRSALQVYFDFGIIRYSDWSELSEKVITIAPVVSFSYEFGKHVSVNMWGGYGPKYSSLKSGTSSHVVIAGLGMGYGL